MNDFFLFRRVAASSNEALQPTKKRVAELNR